MGGTPNSAIEFRDVEYSVGNTTILAGLTVTVEHGEVLVLLGESGCGKTTTLKLINRLVEPTSGSITVNGKYTTDWNAVELRRHIGYVLQDGGLFPHFTVSENIGVILGLLAWEPKKTKQRVIEMLKLVGLDPLNFADRFPHELSGGQRQRVGVARALATYPQVLLLDEPFGALDALTRMSLQNEFAQLVQSLGKTVVFVTHDLHEAMLLGTRIALMEKGRIVLLDTAENFRQSDLPLARAYLDTLFSPGTQTPSPATPVTPA